MATFWIFPLFQLLDGNGDPVSGGKVTFFEPGTTTPKTVYSDTGLTTAHSSPLVADASGIVAPVYIDGAAGVKIDATDSNDVQLPGYPRDNVNGIPVGGLAAASVPFTATTRISADDTQEAIEDVEVRLHNVEEGLDPILVGGSANLWTASSGRDSYAYASGDVFTLRVASANTSAVSLNVDSLGAKFIKKYSGASKVNFASGDLSEGDQIRVVYDGTDFVITDRYLRRATTAQAEAGTATNVFMDPALVKAAIDEQTSSRTQIEIDTSGGNTADGTTSIASGTMEFVASIVGVSTSGTSDLMIQVGDSGGYETSGYLGGAHEAGVANVDNSSGFVTFVGMAAAANYHGNVHFVRTNSTTHEWTMSGVLYGNSRSSVFGGTVTLTNELDRFQITTVGGTDTLDAGAVKITVTKLTGE